MARFSKAFILMFLQLLFLFLIPTCSSEDSADDPPYLYFPANPPEFKNFDPNLPPAEAPEIDHYLEVCYKNLPVKLQPKCASDIYSSIIKNILPSYDCCVQLYDPVHYVESYECFYGLISLFLGLPEIKPIKSEILPRSWTIWVDCYYIVCPTCQY